MGNRPRPILSINAILVFFQLLTAGAAFTDLFGPEVAAMAILVIASVQGGLAFYQQGLVTPLSDPRDGQGRRLIPGE